MAGRHTEVGQLGWTGTEDDYTGHIVTAAVDCGGTIGNPDGIQEFATILDPKEL